MNGIRLLFGTLLDVLGHSVAHEGHNFVPAAVELEGNGFSSDFYLKDFIGKVAPPVLRHPCENQYDAAWVRARLPVVFGFTPEPSELEKSLLCEGFVAVSTTESVGYPFECVDYYGRTGLSFSPEGPDQQTQQSIAKAFWSLLLQEPEELADFETRVYHSGGGFWMHFGCKNGELSYEESDDDDDDESEDELD